MTRRLARAPGSSLHHQLSSVLRSNIVSGQYGRGGYLPGEVALMEMFGVSRATVRRALSTLEAEKLVERLQGKGTVALMEPAMVAGTMAQHRRRIDRNAKGTTVSVLSFGYERARPEIAGALRLGEADEVLKVVRVRLRAAQPLWHMTNYLPRAAAGRLTREALERMTLIDALGRGGHVVDRVEDEVGATLADPAAAEALNVGIGAPLIDVVRIMFDADRVPIAYQRALIPPERHKLHIVIRSDENDSIGPAAEPGALAPRR
jgi:GntR family transcriptional regulator